LYFLGRSSLQGFRLSVLDPMSFRPSRRRIVQTKAQFYSSFLTFFQGKFQYRDWDTEGNISCFLQTDFADGINTCFTQSAFEGFVKIKAIFSRNSSVPFRQFPAHHDLMKTKELRTPRIRFRRRTNVDFISLFLFFSGWGGGGRRGDKKCIALHLFLGQPELSQAWSKGRYEDNIEMESILYANIWTRFFWLRTGSNDRLWSW